MRSVLVWLMVLSGGVFPAAIPANGYADPCQPAELFATDNTAVITDPAAPQDGLQFFETQADLTIAQNGATVTGSTLLVGVSWSPELGRATYERSREFHLCGAHESVHAAAAALRRQFNQQEVLTFEYLPQYAPDAGAVIITVPRVDVAHFRDALSADPAAHARMPDASVTTDHTLILLAGNGDVEVARRLVGEAGGDWNAATTAYGRSEFVH